MHDPRVGRFFAIDPLTHQYPHNSPYAFSENRVLDRNELEGLETGPTFTETISLATNSKISLIKAGEIIDKSQKINNYGVLAIGAVLTDVFITRGWLSRSLLASSYGDFFHSMQMQSYYRGQGNENKAKSYEKEGAEATKDLTLNGLASKVVSTLGKIQKITKRKELTKLWNVASDYIDETKPVFTQTLKKGDVLYQYRIPGTDKGSYFVKSLDVKPENVGLLSKDYSEIYKVTVGSNLKILKSIHKENVGYWRDKTTILEGGGEQIFSKNLKDNATFEKIN